MAKRAEGIDWDLLRSRNPDIVAWLRVCGTGIDYPIVQAISAEMSSHYLRHNAFGMPDAAGTPYLDRRCSADGEHLLVFGHHVIGNGKAMFSPIHRAFEARVFSTIGNALWITPGFGELTLRPLCALHVDKAFAPIQRFSFKEVSVGEWLAGLMMAADTGGDVDDVAPCTRCLTLSTCSSPLLGRRERTLLLFGA